MNHDYAVADDLDEDEDHLIEVHSIKEFFEYLSSWHNSQVKQLEHLLDIPEGTEIHLDDGAEITLEGEALDAFQAGVSVALMQLGTLPFTGMELPENEIH